MGTYTFQRGAERGPDTNLPQTYSFKDFCMDIQLRDEDVDDFDLFESGSDLISLSHYRPAEGWREGETSSVILHNNQGTQFRLNVTYDY